jgi:uncharacterized protein
MKQIHVDMARRLKRLLEPKVTLVDIRIFGSCARGDDQADSDIDIFIEVETLTAQAKKAIRALSWQVGLEQGLVISPLIFSRDEIEQSPMKSSPIVANILREGVSV